VLKRARIKEELKGELTEGVTRSPANNSVERREMTGSDRWGLLISEEKRIEGEDTDSGEVSGPRARAQPRWAAVFLFHFFFDLFPFSFSVFFKSSYPLQFDSN
jgi:hypothetical protein